jgi:predicted  nucleic acid-binding Zn-ribbon protein
MAMTADQRKIKRLEKQVADLKQQLETATKTIRRRDQELMWERQWRQTFQSLMKDAVQEDKLDDYEKMYW